MGISGIPGCRLSSWVGVSRVSVWTPVFTVGVSPAVWRGVVLAGRDTQHRCTRSMTSAASMSNNDGPNDDPLADSGLGPTCVDATLTSFKTVGWGGSVVWSRVIARSVLRARFLRATRWRVNTSRELTATLTGYGCGINYSFVQGHTRESSSSGVEGLGARVTRSRLKRSTLSSGRTMTKVLPRIVSTVNGPWATAAIL